MTICHSYSGLYVLASDLKKTSRKRLKLNEYELKNGGLNYVTSI